MSKYQVIFLPLAEQTFIEAYDWQEERREGAGEALSSLVDKLVERLEDNPFLYQVRYKNTRIAPIRRLDYALHYEIEEQAVLVAALFHQKDDPTKWTKKD